MVAAGADAEGAGADAWEEEDPAEPVPPAADAAVVDEEETPPPDDLALERLTEANDLSKSSRTR
jgi:hypothetical protein